MTATTRSAECSARGTTLMLAFDLGSTRRVFILRHAERQHAPHLPLAFSSMASGFTPIALMRRDRPYCPV